MFRIEQKCPLSSLTGVIQFQVQQSALQMDTGTPTHCIDNENKTENKTYITTDCSVKLTVK